jgi:hypothetical protein
MTSIKFEPQSSEFKSIPTTFDLDPCFPEETSVKKKKT